jgi:hypothetical protein
MLLSRSHQTHNQNAHQILQSRTNVSNDLKVHNLHSCCFILTHIYCYVKSRNSIGTSLEQKLNKLKSNLKHQQQLLLLLLLLLADLTKIRTPSSHVINTKAPKNEKQNACCSCTQFLLFLLHLK